MNNYPPRPPAASPLAQAAWLPAAPPAPLHAAPPAPAAADLIRGYAEWFDWASSQFFDDHLAHVATDAAVAALRAGADPTAAVVAGQRATVVAGAATQPITADKPTQAYAAWFVWARHKVNLDPQRAHLAAAAGRGAQAAGAAVPVAQQQALAAAGVGPTLVSTSGTGLTAAGVAAGFSGISWRDPAQRAIVFGIFCIVMPFLGWVFFVLPIIGLLYSIRALLQSRRAIGIVGVVLNGIGLVWTLVLLFFFR
jgi:hypothetical protein